MTFLKKMYRGALGAVVELEPETEEPTQPGKAGAGVIFASTAQVAPGAPAVLNQEMVKALQLVVTRRATPFTTLEEKANALVEVVPDPVQRVKAAATLLKAEGRTATQIIQAIDAHISDIDIEQRRFVASSEQQVIKKAGGLRAEVVELDKTNMADASRIETLQREINEVVARIEERKQLIADKTAEADNTENEIKRLAVEFTAAADEVKQTLQQRKSVLTSILA